VPPPTGAPPRRPADRARPPPPSPTPSSPAVDLSGIDVHYLPVGSQPRTSASSRSTSAATSPTRPAYEVFIEVQNFGAEPARRQLTLDNGETPIEVKPLELAPGQRRREIYRRADRRREPAARIAPRPVDGPGGTDPFPLDDEAWALLPARKKQLADPAGVRQPLSSRARCWSTTNLTVDRITAAEYPAALAAGKVHQYDVAIFDRFTPPALPPTQGVLYFAPNGDNSPFAIRGVLPRPRITELAEDHPVMRWLTMSDVNFDQANVFAIDRTKGEVALAKSVREIRSRWPGAMAAAS
jgi:hypothetical protein